MVGTIVASSLLLGCAMAPAAAPLQQGLTEVYQKVANAVVVIRTVERQAPPLPGGKPATMGGLGSGVLISAEGRILTSAHVVQSVDEVIVDFAGEKDFKAKVVASDPAADVALLQLERKPPARIPVATLGDSDLARIGDQVFVVGAPLGASHSLSVGYVSARRSKSILFQGVRAEFLQTDAAINPGNSGGPMFDLQGHVIGIVSHILSQSGGSEGLGFVVTSNLANKLLLQQEAFWSGISGLPIAGKLQEVLNSPSPGMLVQRVARFSPADRLGIRGGDLRVIIAGEELVLGGDLIVKAMGVGMDEPKFREEINKNLQSLSPDDPVTVTVLRAGKMEELSATFWSLFKE